MIEQGRRALMLAALMVVAAAAHTDAALTLEETARGLGAEKVKSIEYSGAGRWFQFGQAPAPTLAWPPFELRRYVATVDYDKASARVQIARIQVVEPGRERPAPVEQKVDQFVAGTTAWNVAVPANAAPGAAPVASAQPAAVTERLAEIWATPQGFVKAALANKAATKPAGSGLEATFTTTAGYRYVGRVNAKGEVERVQTWIPTPVLGDTLVETLFSDYKERGGVLFPGRIKRALGGHPILDLEVSAVQLNPTIDIAVPSTIAGGPAPVVTVTAEKLADGVYYLKGGTHHSVAIEQRDYVVVVEAPLNEERSLAVIAKVKETIPGKPIKYLVNTHAHFDHSGGLRTYVDLGATIVTHQTNKAYYEQAWAAPRASEPDRLAASKKAARFETFTEKHTLSDGSRTIEIYSIAGNTHNDAFALVYLPKEKLLVEADAFNPTAADVPPPASPNPYTVNLYANVQKLKLDVERIAALHGPRVTTLGDVRAAIGQTQPSDGKLPAKAGQ